MKIGVIGNGFVGNALYQNFKDKVLTRVYDVNKDRSINTLQETLDSNIVFICLPTPMKDNGECDMSYVNSFFEKVGTVKSLFVIKSTVPIGTTQRLCEMRPDLRIVHNP